MAVSWYVCAGVLLGLSWLTPALAERDAGSHGGSGGGEFHERCPAHFAMFAYFGRAGSALDNIQPICAEVRASGGRGETGPFAVSGEIDWLAR